MRERKVGGEKRKEMGRNEEDRQTTREKNWGRKREVDDQCDKR